MDTEQSAVDLSGAPASAVDLTGAMGGKGRPRSGEGWKGRPRGRTRWVALARMAKKQHGVVSIRQLEGPLGLSQRSVARAVEAGRLHRVHRGVYAVGHTELSQRGECLAAVLAVGPGALLSYYSAGWLWGLWSGSPAPFEVTAFVPRHHQPQ